jgi:diguanylate cyclase (GGDEF)-like protein
VASKTGQAGRNGEVQGAPTSQVKRARRIQPESDPVLLSPDSAAGSRERATAQRLATAARRDEVARARDRTAAARDAMAESRDQAAGVRDHAAQERERHAAETGDLDEAIATSRTVRDSGAAGRQQAALERIAAATDREWSAADRRQAASDRSDAGLDESTGIFRRGTGQLALTHEIDRARRSGGSLVLAVIRVDDLQVVNDTEGHAAGDSLLRAIPAAITSTLRSYDVTVRWCGDEFVCALSDVSLEAATGRVAAIQRALTARRPGARITVGLAELTDGESLESLLALAGSACGR